MTRHKPARRPNRASIKILLQPDITEAHDTCNGFRQEGFANYCEHAVHLAFIKQKKRFTRAYRGCTELDQSPACRWGGRQGCKQRLHQSWCLPRGLVSSLHLKWKNETVLLRTRRLQEFQHTNRNSNSEYSTNSIWKSNIYLMVLQNFRISLKHWLMHNCFKLNSDDAFCD